MAKMFYSLQEAAAKLGMSEEQVKQMAGEGQLQQFRDRDKIMFKREEVDALAGLPPSGLTGLAAAAEPSPGELGPIPLVETEDSDTDVINVVNKAPKDFKAEESSLAVSVFDADDIAPGGAGSKTRAPGAANPSDEDEIALENVGSGSGLLDLTRESDDTSLGAELLDEIYPSGGEGSDLKMEGGPGASGVFDGALLAAEAGSATGLEHLQAGGEPSPVMPTMAISMESEVFDPEGSGMTGGMLLGALVAIVLAMMVAIYGVTQVPSDVTAMMAKNPLLYSVGLLVLSGVLGFAGFMIGKSQSSAS